MNICPVVSSYGSSPLESFTVSYRSPNQLSLYFRKENTCHYYHIILRAFYITETNTLFKVSSCSVIVFGNQIIVWLKLFHLCWFSTPSTIIAVRLFLFFGGLSSWVCIIVYLMVPDEWKTNHRSKQLSSYIVYITFVKADMRKLKMRQQRWNLKVCLWQGWNQDSVAPLS